MHFSKWWKFVYLLVVAFAVPSIVYADGETQPGRDSKQPVDETYTAKIRK